MRGMTVVTDKKSKNIQALIAWGLAILTVGYMIPWAIAATRGKSNAGSIGILNLLLGWTVIGWIVALVMSCGAHQAVAVQQPAAVGTPAGWYPSPDSDGERYWDGQQWTPQVR